MVKHRVLLVDDEVQFLDQAKIFLEKINNLLDVETSSSVRSALDMLDENSFDGIISDYQMPDIDGLEFLRILREDREEEIPFVIFTGKGREEVAMRALNLGADRYLQKGGSPRSQFEILSQAITQEIEHQYTQKAKNEAEKKFRELFEMAPDPALLTDEKGIITEANRALHEKTGFGKDEIIDSSIYEAVFFTERAGEKKERKFKDRMSGKDVSPYTLTIKTKDGDKKFVEVNGEVLKEDGQPIGEIVIARDITERKKLERRLQQSIKRYRELAESLPVGMALISEEDKSIIEINQKMEELIGMAREEIIGKDFFDICPEEDVDEYMDFFDDLNDPNGPAEEKIYDEFHILDEKKNKVPVEINSTILELEGRKLIYSLFKNISERKEMERKIRKERELLDRLFNRLPLMITLYDPNLEKFRVNQRFEEVLGWSKEEIKDIDLMEECYPDPEYREMVADFMQKAEPRWKTFELTTKDGKKVKSSWTNIKLSDDRQVGIGIVKDKEGLLGPPRPTH